MVDREKFKFHSSEEGFNPGYILGELNRAYEAINDLTDQLYNSTGVRLNKERYIRIKDFHAAAKQTMLAYKGGTIGKLTTGQQREILLLVDEILSGKRECVQFQLNRGCDGIKEVFSNKQFPFKLENQKESESGSEI